MSCVGGCCRVEIQHPRTREWGTVCDDDWDGSDARSFCRSIGFSGGEACLLQREQRGDFSQDILADDVRCEGSTQFDTCRFRGFGCHNCVHSEDAGVRCFTGPVAPTSTSSHSCRSSQTGLNQRLLTGVRTADCVGGCCRAEVRSRDDVWGTICDDYWDDRDADLFCVQLGFGEGGTACDLSSRATGRASSPIFLDDVDCSSANNFRSCSHRGWACHNCRHIEDAGVRCISS